MKKLIEKNFVFTAIFILYSINIDTTLAQPRVNVSFNVFYDELSPYGEWIQEPAYGPVWVPDAGPGFRPYHSNGRWVMTEYGNTWVSDYDWGWAPFHYGRWIRNNRRGWAWVPDNEWAPAWVAWRGNDDYYGWAPLMPVLSISLSPSSYAPPVDWWSFVPPAYLYEPQWVNYYPGYVQNRSIINNTTIIHNIYKDKSRIYISGPAADDVRRRGKRDVAVYKIGNGERPGKYAIRDKTVDMYRPVIDRKSRGSGPPTVKKSGESFDKQGTKGNKNNLPDKSVANADNSNGKQIKRAADQGKQNQQERKSQPARSQNKEIKQSPRYQEGRAPAKSRATKGEGRQQQQSRPPKQQLRQQPQSHPQRKELSQPRPQQPRHQQPRQKQRPAQQQMRQPSPQHAQPAQHNGGGGKQGGGKGKGK